MIDKRAQTAWLAALMLGAVAGVWGLIMPVTGLVLAATATLFAVVAPGGRRFALSGVWLGFGGIWTIFLLPASLDCVLGPAPSDACSGGLFATYLVVGMLMGVAGLLATASAFRGRQAT